MLNGVTSEPGYGSEKQGKEREFVTTDEMPSHSHTLNRNSNSGTESWCLIDHEGITKWQPGNVGSTGGNQPHGNIPPVIAAYAWKRTV